MMLSDAENELLTRVGPGTAMGSLMSRYWFPVLLAEELDQPGGTPKKVRLLGRDLVAFRDTEGRVGILDEYCSHRGASLVLARNEDCGLRCLYHGWKYGYDGEVQEIPTEPSGRRAKLQASVRHPAYMSHEAGGLIWACVGDRETAFAPPPFIWTALPADRIVVTKILQRCNWLQALEGAMDPAHLEVLHHDAFKSDMSFVDSAADSLEVRYHDTDYGFVMGILREPDGAANGQRHVTANPFVLPSTVLTSLNQGRGTSGLFVPVDDENTFVYTVTFSYEEPIDREAILKMRGMQMGVDINERYESPRNAANGWLQDREAMARGESYSGLGGLTLEDVVIGESQGPIRSRAREHLGPLDLAIAHLRQVYLGEIEKMADGARAASGVNGEQLQGLRSRTGLVQDEHAWAEVMSA
jgi:phthalate 4,5-dioxygenase oxygenase subunit